MVVREVNIMYDDDIIVNIMEEGNGLTESEHGEIENNIRHNENDCVSDYNIPNQCQKYGYIRNDDT
jgi:hypothetical protein